MSIKSACCLGGMLALSLFSAGCSSTGTVTGKVTFMGEALGGGTVVFVSEGKKTIPAKIAPDGTYTIVGIPSGPVKISVETKSAIPADAGALAMGRPEIPANANLPPGAAEAMGGSVKQGKYVQIPDIFGDPDQSGLTATVTGGNQVHNIEMK